MNQEVRDIEEIIGLLRVLLNVLVLAYPQIKSVSLDIPPNQNFSPLSGIHLSNLHNFPNLKLNRLDD